METNQINGNGKKVSFNIGDALHLIQIAILLISIGIVYEKFNIILDTTATHSDQLNRIEHYLSAKDSKYWRDSRQDK